MFALSPMWIKLGTAGVLLLMAFLSSIAPRYFMSSNVNFFSLGNMMASGVLLGASLVHILPDAQELFDSSDHKSYPWASFICGLTFTAFLVLEELLHNGPHDHFVTDHLPHEHHHDDDAPIKHSKHTININMNESTAFFPRSSLIHCNGGGSILCSSIFMGGDSAPRASRYLSINTTTTTSRSPDATTSHRITAAASPHHFNQSVLGRSASWMNKTLMTNQDHYHEDEHLERHLHGSATSSVALMVALSVHSLLEGLALGFSDSRTIVSTALAILLHKVFAGFALGSAMTAASDSLTDESYLTMILLFSFSSPIGIAIAAVLESNMYMNDVIVATMQAAVSGTFLYIAIVEIGMKELLLSREQTGSSLNIGNRMQYLKLASFFVGYCFMSSVAIWV